MEALLHRLLLALSERVPVELIGPSGVRAWAPSNCRVLAELPFAAGRFLPAAAMLVLRHADPRRHQLCFGGSGLMAPVLSVARWRGVRTGVYLHGLDLVYPNPVYQRLFVARLPAVDCAIANSRHTRDLALGRGLPAAHLSVVNPGVEMPSGDLVGAPVLQGLRERWGPGPILLSVGRLVARKGVAEFIERTMPGLLRELPGLRLLVAGGEPPGASGEQTARILAAVHGAGLEASVGLLGRVSAAELAALYQLADLHVLPLVERRGDVEGFGMVILEAAARGVPSVAFDLGGVADALDSPEGGALVAAGDYSAFAAAVRKQLDRACPEARLHLVERIRARSWRRFGEESITALGLLP
ncbi:MAG: glycosyltransferase family 4 protein [Stagnimonas sp.]|nr:glycosyltransferase family 4 protein [Stagnimonas sp.]